MKQQQPSVMETATPKQRQAVSNAVQATLQMLVQADLKIYGEVSQETLEAVQTQGFVVQNGTVQKDHVSQTESASLVQKAASPPDKAKPSLRTQLRTTVKEMEKSPHPTDRGKGGEAR